MSPGARHRSTTNRWAIPQSAQAPLNSPEFPPTNQETRRAVVRLGRLAVSPSVQWQSLGGDLLFAPGSRALAVAAQAIQYDCACHCRGTEEELTLRDRASAFPKRS
jgi:hypothetical protein